MDQDVGAIDGRGEEVLIGFELQRIWHQAGVIGEHAVRRRDGETFDLKRSVQGVFLSRAPPISEAVIVACRLDVQR